ncbi:glycosyltransferase involved in cell wall biosynthesis [Gelidibacter sediminis]|uniref:Glycosyltransferase involved in cell wall biosynthesis n=1 Tax=Gelidibacter sediminis TaxID=1608710 RepID=A0A4R7Q5Y8_9FLAO|nr:glycosyltransferase [Gelidibacter sediminis]TDU42888.1 glycosyltransferase involved in cell wall biosynthesis [Gelidibacter sediminis]
MRVIHYIGSLRFGGIERLVFDLVSQQIKREDTIVAIGVGKRLGEFSSNFESLGIEIVNFELNSGFDLNPLKIINIVRCFKDYDIIHLHGFHLSVAVASILARRKLIYTEHGNFGFGRQITNTDRLSFLLRRLFYKYCPVQICCNSKFTLNYVKSNFYNGKRLTLIYNGSALFNSVNEDLKHKLNQKYLGKFILGTTSRLAGFKRVDRLITAFSDYIKLNSNAVLVVVGDGIKREKLEQQVLDLKIRDYVVFEGYQQEVATFQSIFDVCVFPSENEPFGLVAVECYSKRKPVLVFRDGGGITEIVDVFQPEDVCQDSKDLLTRLEYYKTNRFIWKNDYNARLKYFSLERMEEDYYKKYKEIV